MIGNHGDSSHILSYGDRISEGTFSLHSRFSQAVNFEDAGTLVSVVTGSIGSGPFNIVVDSLNAAVCHATVRVERDRFRFGKICLRKDPERLYDSSMELYPEDSGKFFPNLKALRDILARSAPRRSLAFLLDHDRAAGLDSGYERGFLARMREGLNHMMDGRLVEGARRFKGAGFGLTPSGDDFLYGFLIGLNAAELIHGECLESAKQTVYENGLGGNLIVNAGLLCAREGRVFARFRKLIHALARSGDEEVSVRARRLFDIGETSGADIATGFYVSARLYGLATEYP